MKRVRIGYLRFKDETNKRLLSGTINIGNFINGLSHYADMTSIRAEPEKIFIQELKSSDADYLLAAAEYFTPKHFILREKYQIDTPFIIKLIQICPSINSIIYSVPLLRKDDVIIAPSRYAKESFLRISDKFDVYVIPNFVDVRFIDRHRCRHSHDDKRIITYMGRLTERKGIGILVDCLPEIIDKIPNAHLNLIGPLSGSTMDDSRISSYVKSLIRQVKKHKLADRVHFLGVRLGQDKYRLLSRSDIFINPTTAMEELFPVANIEALACGVPVIATDWAGNKEIVRDGENGYLVGVGYDEEERAKIDTAQLASLTVKLLKDKHLNLKMKENALKTARKYDYRKIAPQFVKLLKKRKSGVKTKNRWDLIKNRCPTDFPHLFNREFLFFIHSQCIADFGRRTYDFLYKLYRSPASKHHADKRKRRRTILDKKIYNDYMAYLLLGK